MTKHHSPVLMLLPIALGLLGCDSRSSGPQPPTGSQVTVQFRRDYLGGAKDGPASATLGSINDNQVALQGKLVRVTDEWLVVENAGREQWVPRAAVLYIDAVKAQ
jgi:hypothetical protein